MAISFVSFWNLGNFKIYSPNETCKIRSTWLSSDCQHLEGSFVFPRFQIIYYTYPGKYVQTAVRVVETIHIPIDFREFVIRSVNLDFRMHHIVHLDGFKLNCELEGSKIFRGATSQRNLQLFKLPLLRYVGSSPQSCSKQSLFPRRSRSFEHAAFLQMVGAFGMLGWHAHRGMNGGALIGQLQAMLCQG